MKVTRSDSWSRPIIAVTTDNWTVAALVRLAPVQTSLSYAWIVSHGPTTPPANGWEVGIWSDGSGNPGGLQGVAHDTGLTPSGTMRLPRERWLVLAWERVSTVWKGYVDGFPDPSIGSTMSPGAASGETYVNRTSTNPNAGIVGDIAWVGQWNRALTASQHRFLAGLGNPKLIAGAAALWNFAYRVPFEHQAGLVLTTTNGTPVPGENPLLAMPAMFAAREMGDLGAAILPLQIPRMD